MKHFRQNANVKFQFYFGFPINTKLLSLNMIILVDIKKNSDNDKHIFGRNIFIGFKNENIYKLNKIQNIIIKKKSV